MKDLLNNGFQPVSETEMLMVEGGAGDNGPQKGKDPSCPLPDEGGGRIGRKKKQKRLGISLVFLKNVLVQIL